MLIVPFAKSMNWKKPPVITILLVVVNTLLFSFWQVNDEKLAYDASQYYMASSLPKIELPKYEAFLRQQNRLEEANEMVHMQQGHAARVMLWQLQHDASFLQLIQDKNLLKADDPKRPLWLKERRIFDAKFNDITTESHAFKPAFPEISDAFSHMFMHGSIMHLIGNMVFLLIVGLVVERLLGSPLYLLVYLVGGLAALAFFTLGNLNSAVPLLGASGAIAALMGLYAALFGARKIPFFYSIGFYFDCIRAPAWILLLAWLGNEVFQFFTNTMSNVAYLAHFGGLIAGGFMGYIITHFQIIDKADLEIEEEQALSPAWSQPYCHAMSLLGKMETLKASKEFSRLQKQHPNEPDILMQFYNSSKYQPESSEYHQSSMLALGETGQTILPAKQIQKVFVEYLKLAQPKPILNRKLLHQVGKHFLRNQFLEEAQHVVKVLIHNDGKSENTAHLAVSLARMLHQKQEFSMAKKLLNWVLYHHHDSNMAIQARTIIQALDKA
ncbi:MAG: hypothetical protein COB41_05895 [Proteobacteria bacterium]|nr:MAG: hypothetical protein COB41_05895 [Pseudomonadota bacterium]